MFSRAIVRRPAKSLVNGLTSANLGKPDYENALIQHEGYINALIRCGLEVTILDALEDFPDSTFVEDVALLTPHCAIVTNPGAASRNGENAFIKPALEKFYQQIEIIKSPGTVEAGDIMMVGSHFYIGLSERTNKSGAEQMIALLKKHGLTGSIVNLKEFLHLKTGINYLENNNMLASGEFLTKSEFQQFNLTEIDTDEAYAANSLWINNKVLTPKGFPKTRQKIESLGYEIIEVDVSEFEKLDGGLSCLSLRF
ncbi:MAG: arginine deiminase family protein [Gammaproteobacteria bacterium]|nr:arginine deiminase family protein [Gammaproteobacteria bacterium]MDH5628584.1 arginine deiminase family protein [Gammaproteobacteria bacterium]